MRHLLTMSSGSRSVPRCPSSGRSRDNQDRRRFLAIFRDVAVAVPSRHPYGLTATPTSSCWERSSNDRPAARLRRWSRPRSSGPLGLATHSIRGRRSPKPALGYTRTPPAGARAGFRRLVSSLGGAQAGGRLHPAPRWAVATRRPTTWPVLPTRSWAIGFSAGK